MRLIPRIPITREGREHRAIRRLALLGIAVVALALPYSLPAFEVFRYTLVIVWAIAVLGLNLLTGYSGQISLGHSFFFAIGAYTAAVLIEDYSWPYLATLPIAFALTFVLGFLFGIPAVRLEGLYLALVTLALAVVAVPFLKRFDGITGGSQGIRVSKPEAPEWTGLANDQWLYFVCLAVAALMFLAARNMVTGRVGRALVGMRDNEIAAATAGVNPTIFKSLTFAYSAAFAGIAGGLYTFVVGFVSPESFTIVLAISFLAAMVVGGLATITGAVFGALFVRFVPVWAGDFNEALAGVIYGVSLIVVMFVMPGGVMGLLRRIWALVVDMRPPQLVPAGGPPAGGGAEERAPDAAEIAAADGQLEAADGKV